jgi:protein associated with RNAse G/E
VEPLTVDVDFRKWGDRQHWRFKAPLLGEDEYGTWVGAPPGVAYTGPRGAGFFEPAFVQLFPRSEWWVAVWNATGDVELYVDVATPPQWPAPDHATMIDLDLDVFRRRDGSVTLDDEDEFAEHRVLYRYPDDVVERALATARHLMDAVSNRREPFGAASDRWFQSLAAH